ncbi:MAG: MFS transporter [Pseudomonadota bacterium]
MAQPFIPPCDNAIIRAEPCPRAADREIQDSRKRWVLAACVLASSMAFIDGSALTVALPALRADFEASLQGVQWVINAYVLALAALTLIGGAMADLYGRARILIAGCVVFAAASVACALAPSIDALIAARLAQGIGAALVTPASLALIGETYPEEERGAAIGVWASASALTTAGGPLLGGWLTVEFGWEAVFWMNPPLAAAAIAVLVWKAPPGLRKPGQLDWLGGVWLALALALLAYGLSNLSPGEGAEPEQHNASATSAFPIIFASIALLLGLFFQQRRAAHPMLAPDLFRSADFSWLNLATLLMYAGLSLMFFLVPFQMIEDRGLSPTLVGLTFLPFTLCVGLLSRYAGHAADRFGARPVMMTGAGLAAFGLAGLSVFIQQTLVIGVLIPMTIIGLGFAALVAPLTASVMASVTEEDTGLASGLNNTASRVAQLIGVAAAAAIAPQAGGYGLGYAGAALLCVGGGAAFWMVRTNAAPSI